MLFAASHRLGDWVQVVGSKTIDRLGVCLWSSSSTTMNWIQQMTLSPARRRMWKMADAVCGQPQAWRLGASRRFEDNRQTRSVSMELFLHNHELDPANDTFSSSPTHVEDG